MAYCKVGFHGIGTGIGDYMRALDGAGVPFAVKAVDNAGFAAEAAGLARASGVPHNILLRWAVPNGRPDDHPRTDLPADAAAEDLWLSIKAQIDKSPEIHPYKDLIRIEPTNEISTKDQDPAWVGRVLVRLAQLLNAEGWAAALGGFNNGQPEPEDWLGGLRQLLEYVNDHPQNTITVHEGKTTTTYLESRIDSPELYPHLIGRFIKITEAAKALGLMVPGIEISEWGWAYNDMPDYGIAMRDVADLSVLLAKYPTVRAAYLWNLDRGWGDLGAELSAFIPQVTAYALQGDFLPDPDPEPGPDPEPQPESFREALWAKGLGAQVMQLNQDAALQKVMVADGFYPTDPEWRLTWEGQAYAGQGGERLAGGYERRVYYCPVGQWDRVDWINGPEAPPPTLDLGLSVPVSKDYVILEGGKFDAYRNYSWRPDVKQAHEGLDFSTIGGGGLMLASAPGRVIYAGSAGGAYGYYVKLEHREPVPFYTYYAHMANVTVKVGQEVQRHEVLGTVGSTGNSSGDHAHLTAAVPGLGLQGYIVADVVNPADHMVSWDVPEPYYPPAPGTRARIGVHTSADPGLAAGELDVIATARPAVIKVLSNLDPAHVGELRARHPGIQWIVRAFLSMWENGAPRTMSPWDFYNSTVGDVRRTVDRIGLEDTWIELHNEPNLILEGLSGSWTSGATFSAWWLELLRLYREAFPSGRFLFPGLSPGHAIPDFRAEKFAFLKGALPAIKAADGLADHVYWGVGETVGDAVGQVDRTLSWLAENWVNKRLWITEASSKASIPGSQKGQEYVTFWRNMTTRPAVEAVTYFVASASSPDFQLEVWVKNGQSVGIAEAVGSR